MGIYEGNELFKLINRLRAAFIGREEIAPFFGGVDFTPPNYVITMANNAAAVPFVADNNFSGLLMLDNTTDGSVGVFACGGSVVTLITDTVGSKYSAAAGTASRINVYYSAGPNYALTIENKSGGSRNVIVAPIRIRAAA